LFFNFAFTFLDKLEQAKRKFNHTPSYCWSNCATVMATFPGQSKTMARWYIGLLDCAFRLCRSARSTWLHIKATQQILHFCYRLI